MTQMTLQKLINTQSVLNEPQKQSLYDLLKGSSREETRNRLYRKIFNVPLSLWPNYGIFGRVHLEGNTFSYCAGQHYPSEITEVRNLILKG
jgi:hypothetical protein